MSGRILITDDDTVSCQLLSEILEKESMWNHELPRRGHNRRWLHSRHTTEACRFFWILVVTWAVIF